MATCTSSSLFGIPIRTCVRPSAQVAGWEIKEVSLVSGPFATPEGNFLAIAQWSFLNDSEEAFQEQTFFVHVDSACQLGDVLTNHAVCAS